MTECHIPLRALCAIPQEVLTSMRQFLQRPDVHAILEGKPPPGPPSSHGNNRGSSSTMSSPAKERPSLSLNLYMHKINFASMLNSASSVGSGSSSSTRKESTATTVLTKKVR